MVRSLLNNVRRRVTNAVTDPFGHAEYPLARTMEYRGDPGICGPGSASWAIIGDVAGFIGGIRALLIQASHPEVVAGVADHSRYEVDPLGRLSRTSAYVTATTFGAMPEVEQAIRYVRRAHRPVKGVSHRGTEYDADAPPFAAWVHNALTDSFLVAYEFYGREALSPEDADRFVAEQRRIGELHSAAPLPSTAAELHQWIAEHPGLDESPGQKKTAAFLRKPPLSRGQLFGYRILFAAAVATLPPRLRRIIGVRRIPGARIVGRYGLGILRWALGSSPTWHLSLLRCDADIPEGLFVQPLPTEASGSVGMGLQD